MFACRGPIWQRHILTGVKHWFLFFLANFEISSLLFCDTIYVVITGQCFIYDHTMIFRVVLLYKYVAMKSVLFVFGVTGSGYV